MSDNSGFTVRYRYCTYAQCDKGFTVGEVATDVQSTHTTIPYHLATAGIVDL